MDATLEGQVTRSAAEVYDAFFASIEGLVRLWSTDPDDMLDQLCSGPGRNFSLRERHRYLDDLPRQPTCEDRPTPPG